MYDRFTDRARKVFQLANMEAQRFNHEYTGTEHILLGLSKEGGGVAAHVLKMHELNLGQLRAEVEKLVQAGPDMVTMGKLPQTPRAKAVVERAMQEARNLDHSHVGTEHILLGLIGDDEGIASQVLQNMGATFDSIRRVTMDLLGLPAVRHMHFEVKVLQRTERYVSVRVYASGTSCGILLIEPEGFGRFINMLKIGAEHRPLNAHVDVIGEQTPA